MIACPTSGKILTLRELADKLAWARRVESWEPWPVIVQAHGCFDVLHIGHVRHLKEAAEMGDLLVVTVTPDRFVNKGNGRPLFPAELRAEVLASLDCVDHVVITETATAFEAISQLRPNTFVKGPECRDLRSLGLLKEIDAAETVGATFAFTTAPVWSSTEILRRLGV